MTKLGFWASAGIGFLMIPVQAAAALAEGIQPEGSALVLLARIFLGATGLFLLVAGRRIPHCTLGVIFLGLGCALSWPLAARHSYGLALLGAWAVAGALAALAVHLPRISTGLTGALILPGLFGAWLLQRGDFAFSGALAGLLALSGAAAGCIFPGPALGLVAVCTGTLLLAVSLPGSAPGAWVFGVIAGGFIWQAFFLLRVWPPQRAFLLPAQEEYRRRMDLRHHLGTSAGVLLGAALLTALLVPQPRLASSPSLSRLRMLDAKTCGYLRRPGLVLSPEDSLYLFGRPLPAALLYEREGPLARLALLAVGRSPSVGIHRMRTIKEPAEIRAIRRACAITSKAFVDIAPLIRPGATEADLERAILGSFARSGATGVAFRSVVGSGANATLPHYDRNDATLRDGFIVLDIGCSFENYASDMTRTFPVTGKYAPAQTRLMEVVAEAHEAARKTLKPGATVEDVDAAARAVIERAGFGEFFTHGIGHHVGLSVHDPHAEILQPNMVLTVEPGIYIPRGAKVAPAYRGLGVRIEDTYLITADGAEALTHFPHIP